MSDTENTSGLSTFILWALGVVLLLGGIVAGFYFTSFDTQYAPGYSEKAFKSIKLGDTEDRVLSLIGNPFSTNDIEPYVEWIYSADEQKHFSRDGVGKATYTTVRFDEAGQVDNISGTRQTSANSYTFGDGQNHLGLTDEQIEILKGANQDVIRQRFGPPVAVYKQRATKVLYYTRSPSSANYHARTVSLDKDGKVVHVRREIYWD